MGSGSESGPGGHPGSGLSEHSGMWGMCIAASGGFAQSQLTETQAEKQTVGPVEHTEFSIWGFACDSDSAREKLVPKAAAVHEDVAAMKPHTGPAAWKRDSGG